MVQVYAGIDEAGYGPMFGPFVIARSVFVIEGDKPEAPDAAPDLWKILSGGVCRSPRDRKRRIAVDDSKKLYKPDAGVGNLERAVLSFLHAAGLNPTDLESLLRTLGTDAECRMPDLLWYGNAEGGPALPTGSTEGELAISRAVLKRCCEAAKVKVDPLRAAVIYEDRFNKICAATRSKSSCAWRFVSQHLLEIWEQYGRHHPTVVVDRQGGRKVYHPLLQLLLPGAAIRLLDESDDVSRYVLTEAAGGKAMTVSFEIDSEKQHLPVALASMTAKYARELLMGRFNRFFTAHLPGVEPTAGYAEDGKRFLAEIEPLIAQLQLPRDLLIRQR